MIEDRVSKIEILLLGKWASDVDKTLSYLFLTDSDLIVIFGLPMQMKYKVTIKGDTPYLAITNKPHTKAIIEEKEYEILLINKDTLTLLSPKGELYFHRA